MIVFTSKDRHASVIDVHSAKNYCHKLLNVVPFLQILRVDHAGEFGADRIYAGQMFVLGKTDVGDLIQEMWDQEKEHKVSHF